MSNRSGIPEYFTPVLQGIAHWVNYKAQYYRGHLLSEGALVGELTQLFAASITRPLQVRCELLYKSHGARSLGQKRMDLAIGEPTLTQGGEIRATDLVVIEVKRFNPATWTKIEEDFHKLVEIKKAVPSCRAFQVVIGQTDRPSLLFNKNHEMLRRAIFRAGSFYALPRMSKKSFHTKRNSERGAYAALLEVLPA